MTTLANYSFGTGDRFAHQAAAQLSAVTAAAERGVTLDIVWNKSFREHTTIGSQPVSTREAADAAVKAYRESGAGQAWKGAYYLDADHIGPGTVGIYLPYAEFYTLDVADAIGKDCDDAYRQRFLSAAQAWIGKPFAVDGLDEPIRITEDVAARVAGHYLFAAKTAGDLYRHIADARRGKDLIIEVSMDETATPQTPEEIFPILLALSLEAIPLQTFAPRFSGRFNKGVQYVGDPAVFEREFEKDALILRHAASVLGLPENLKLSLHSGSDKFAIYPGIRKVLERHGVGIHVKTAGTTWLEEIIGLCEVGGDGLEMAKDIYRSCLEHIDELSAPYAEVIDIDRGALPTADEVDALQAGELAAMIRHDLDNPSYNPSMRQLFHVGYKIAAKKGRGFLDQLEKHEEAIAVQVKTNLFDRHIRKIFPGIDS
jgi:hypothetical protein